MVIHKSEGCVNRLVWGEGDDSPILFYLEFTWNVIVHFQYEFNRLYVMQNVFRGREIEELSNKTLLHMVHS